MAGKTAEFLSEHRIRSKDGSYKLFRVKACVVSRTEENEPVRMVGTITDLSGMKTL